VKSEEKEISYHVYLLRIKGITEKQRDNNSAIKKGDTHAESLKLYKEGQTVADIAKTRNLTISTIETHLTKFVRSGDIKIEDLVSREKRIIIESAFKDFDGGSISPIKQQLGNNISFGEIRLVMAGLGLTQKKLSE